MKTLIVLFGFLMIICSGFTQIIYHAFSPIQNTYVEEEGFYSDTTAHVYVDINNDSIDDLDFRLSYYYGFVTPSTDEKFYCSVWPLDEQFQVAINYNGPCSLTAFIEGDTISNNLVWDDWMGGAMIHYPEGSIYCNPFSSYKYLGIKYTNNEDIYFGWAKMYTYNVILGYQGSYAEFFLSEYAFNTEPNKGLIAGDTLTSLLLTNTKSVKSPSDLIIYPNPAKREFYIDLKNYQNDFKTIEIYSLKGKLLKSEIIDNSSINNIDITSFDKGLYIVKLFSNDRVQIIKLVKN